MKKLVRKVNTFKQSVKERNKKNHKLEATIEKMEMELCSHNTCQFFAVIC